VFKNRNRKLFPNAFGKIPNSHNYVQFLNFSIMKKVFLFSFFIVASAFLTSCTADSVPSNNTNQTVNAEDTGGQGGNTSNPKP
jgi:hypothetical protein